MAKKTEETVEGNTTFKVVVPLPITTDFGREDLNTLRDTVNFLLSKE